MDAETNTVTRRCKWCGRRYVVVKWSKSQGCAECAPTLEQAIAEAEAAGSPPARTASEA